MLMLMLKVVRLNNGNQKDNRFYTAVIQCNMDLGCLDSQQYCCLRNRFVTATDNFTQLIRWNTNCPANSARYICNCPENYSTVNKIHCVYLT